MKTTIWTYGNVGMRVGVEADEENMMWELGPYSVIERAE